MDRVGRYVPDAWDLWSRAAEQRRGPGKSRSRAGPGAGRIAQRGAYRAGRSSEILRMGLGCREALIPARHRIGPELCPGASVVRAVAVNTWPSR